MADSTDVHAWSSGHGEKVSDPDAGWAGKRTKTRDGRENVYYWFGYKVHLLVCGEDELPLGFTVTPANVNDHEELPHLVGQARERHPDLVEKAKYLWRTAKCRQDTPYEVPSPGKTLLNRLRNDWSRLSRRLQQMQTFLSQGPQALWFVF
ncbi:MAG: transposase [Bacillota bacterium]